MILEILARQEKTGYKYDVSHPDYLEIIAEDLRIDLQQLLSIIETCVRRGLFDKQLWEEKILYSPELGNPRNNYGRISGEEWHKLRRSVFLRDDFTCQYCGEFEGDLHCDHIIPLSRGGTNALDNLVTACKQCNLSKSDKTPQEWQGRKP